VRIPCRRHGCLIPGPADLLQRLQRAGEPQAWTQPTGPAISAGRLTPGDPVALACHGAHQVKRCPQMSVNRSRAPGCGRSLRTMTRIPSASLTARACQSARPPMHRAAPSARCRRSPLTCPLTESNRRPSPYHGRRTVSSGWSGADQAEHEYRAACASPRQATYSSITAPARQDLMPRRSGGR
jgi:hypothetical protein